MRIIFAIVSLLFVLPLYGQDFHDFSSVHEFLLENIEKQNSQANIDFVESERFHLLLAKLKCKEAGKLNHLAGVSYYTDYQENKAIGYFKTAAYTNWKNCPDVSKEDIANTIYNIGVCYQYSSEIYKGKQYLDTAIVILESIPDYPKSEIGYKYEGVGYYYVETNNYHRAHSYLQQASNLAEHLDPITLVTIRINQMILYNKYSKYEEARAVYKETEHFFNKNESSLDDDLKAVYFINVAEIKYNLEDYDKSEFYVNRAFKFSLDDTELASDLYEILGNICNEKNDLQCAKEYFNKAYSIREKTPSTVQSNLAESYTLHNLSEVYLKEGRFSKALELIDQAIKLTVNYSKYDREGNPILKGRQLSSPLELVFHLQLKEKIILKINDANSLIRIFHIAGKIDSIIDKSMQSLSFEQSKLELLPLIQTHTDEAIEVALRLYQETNDENYLTKALYFSTQAKSYILQQVIQENRFFHDNADPLIEQEVNTIKSDIAEIQNALLIKESDSLLNALITQEMKLEQAMAKFHETTEESQDRTELSYDDIQERLSDDMVLLDIYEGDRNVYFFWITKDRIHYTVDPTDVIVPQIDSINRYNSDPSIPYDSICSNTLYRTIFDDKVHDFLPKDYRLKVIPEGTFFQLNFETLLDNEGKFLFFNHPVSYAYHPKFLFQERKGKDSYKFLGFGTHYNENLDRELRRKKYIKPTQSLGKLYNAEAEVLSCNEFMEGSLFLGTKASLENFKKHAPDYNIIYLSLHGLVDEKEGLKTGIAFDNTEKQFVLDDSDLNELRLQSKLIIMSACHSASGKNFKGEGLKGMTRSFFASGAKNVLSSIWTAGENSSMQILPLFLKKYVSGHPMDISIQKSKIDYIKASPPLLRHPFYWGNYVVYGEYEKEGDASKWSWYVGGLLLLIGLSFLVFRRKANS